MKLSTPVSKRCISASKALKRIWSTWSGVAEPKADLVFLHVKAGMTRIVENGSDWRMADVIWVDRGAINPKAPSLFQVADVDTGVINWVNADLVTHIVPRV